MQIKVNNFERVHTHPGGYEATLIDVRPGEIAAKTFADGSQAVLNVNGKQDVLWWKFRIWAYPVKNGVQGEAAWLEVEGMTTLATGKNSKLRAWVTALGGNLSGDSFDLASLYGRKASVVLIDKVDAENNERSSKIDTVMAIAAAVPPPPAPAAVAFPNVSPAGAPPADDDDVI